MLHVNLIGAQQREQQALQRVTLLCVCVAAVVLTTSVVLALPGVVKSSSLDRELKGLKDDIKDNAPTVARIEALRAKEKDLEPLSQMVRESQQSCVDWLRVLLLIQRSTPDQVWLKDIRAEFDPKKWAQQLTITGEAATDAAGALLAHNLEGTGPMASVRNTKSSTPGQAGAETVFTFTLEAQLRYVIGEYVQ